MGCDIHCYIESGRKRRDHDADGSEKVFWSGFGGRINPGRNYDIFGLIAGVRREELKLFDPRGIPDDVAWSARFDNEIFIHETPGEGYVTPETAANWVELGASRYTDDTQKWVTSPDHHTHTWLTPDEWEQVITHESLTYGADDDYFAMLAAMRELEKRGNLVRVVIWFDN